MDCWCLWDTSLCVAVDAAALILLSLTPTDPLIARRTNGFPLLTQVEESRLAAGPRSSGELCAGRSQTLKRCFPGQQLKQLRDKMKQAQKRVNQQMEKDRQVARQLVVDGKRDRALLLLKRKKRMEKTLLDLDSKLELLEKMVSDIEFAEIEIKLLDGLKTGNSVLQQLNQLLSVENVHSILQETKESADRQKVSTITNSLLH